MSTLRQAVQDYIEMRRGLAFKLREIERALIDFAAFLEANDTPNITTELALAWAQRPSRAQPAYWARRLGYVRVFARHRAAADPRTQIPPDGLLPFRPKRARPYLYTNEDIQRLLSAALEMPCRYTPCKLRPWTYYCLFGLLSVSGLRVGEARNLKLSDINFDAAVLTIRGTKFGKSRLVPMHASTCAVLQDYLKRRRQQCSPSGVSLFVHFPVGQPPCCRRHSSNILYSVSPGRAARQLTATARACMTCGRMPSPEKCRAMPLRR
jgi:integrase/recombinase XerD